MTGEIFFIDYGTKWSNNNYNKLRKIYPFVRKIPYTHSLSDIFEKAREKTKTFQFWVVDGSIVLLPSFRLSYSIKTFDYNYIHSWRILSNLKLRHEGIYLLTKEYKLEYKYLDKLVGYDNSSFDIVQISYNEPNANENFLNLERHTGKKVLRVQGVTGIHNAHLEAAKISKTPMLWVVDADAKIVPKFKFNYKPRRWDRDTVHIWRSLNPLNGLEYGYGGVKLLPRHLVLEMNLNSVDMTTSISNKLKVMPEISNITCFNTDAFSTWRSAFRECVKLSSNVIDSNSINLKRLDAWCKLNESVPYGFYAYLGAMSGRKYGQENASNKEALSKINDFNWLADRWQEEKSQISP